MTAFSDADRAHMARALVLAEKGLYTTTPNPRVPSVGSELPRPIVTFADGVEVRATVKVAVPPASVVSRPEVGVTLTPGAPQQSAPGVHGQAPAGGDAPAIHGREVVLVEEAPGAVRIGR